MATFEDRKGEAGRTIFALVRAALDNDEAALQALVGSASEQELRDLAHAFTGAFLDLFVRLNMAHTVLGKDEGAFILSGDGVDEALADPAVRDQIAQNVIATQARFIRG